MEYESRIGDAFFDRDIPAVGGDLAEQHARRRRRITTRLPERANRTRCYRQHSGVADSELDQRPAAYVVDRVGDRQARRDETALLIDDERVDIKRADGRRIDRDAPPVGTEFICDDLRQQGGDALAHFALRNDDGDPPACRYLEPRIEQRLVGRNVDVGFVITRPQYPPNCESDGRAAADQQPAAADRKTLRLVLQMRKTGHDRP